MDNNCHAFITLLQKTIYQCVRQLKSKTGQKVYLPWLNGNMFMFTYETKEPCLKVALQNKAQHDRWFFITLRNKVVKKQLRPNKHFY